MSTSMAAARTARDERSLLRAALKLDAVVTGANGAAYLAAAGPLGDLFGLSPALLRAAGALLVVFAGAVWMAGSRPAIPRGAVWAIVAANTAWAIVSVVVAAVGWGSPTTVGTVWLILQAIVVLGFADLQLLGLKRAAR